MIFKILNKNTVGGQGQSEKIKMNIMKKRAIDLISIKAFTILIGKSINYENNSPAHRLIY